MEGGGGGLGVWRVAHVCGAAAEAPLLGWRAQFACTFTGPRLGRSGHGLLVCAWHARNDNVSGHWALLGVTL